MCLPYKVSPDEFHCEDLLVISFTEMSTGKVAPALAQVAITNYRRLPGLSNFYISQFWRLEI